MDSKGYPRMYRGMSEKAQIWLQRAGDTKAKPIGVGEVEGRLERNAQVKFTYMGKPQMGRVEYVEKPHPKKPGQPISKVVIVQSPGE